MKRALFLAQFAFILTASAAAFADFEIIPEATGIEKIPVSPALPSAAKTGNVGQYGLSLKDALKSITPPRWSVFYKDIDPEMRVEKPAGHDFDSNLKFYADSYNIVFRIDDSKKAVFASPGVGGVRVRTVVESLATKADTSPSRASDQSAWGSDGSVKIVLGAGEKLSDVLDRFLKKQGWTLAWDANGDYEIQILSVHQAADLPQGLTKVLAPYRLHAEIHTDNRVVSVVPNDRL